MSIHLDAGDILAQEAIDILPDETAGELETRLAPIGGRLAWEIVNGIAAGPVAGQRQDKSQATKAPKLKKEDGLIDWSRHGRDVCNQVRAMTPWPTAYTFLHNAGQSPLRLIVHKTAWRDQTSENRKPGELIAGKSELLISAGQSTAVEVLELQPAGKRRMKAEEFLRGRHVASGGRLDARAVNSRSFCNEAISGTMVPIIGTSVALPISVFCGLSSDCDDQKALPRNRWLPDERARQRAGRGKSAPAGIRR